ncbi:MAG: ABC transporter ATP-binding protein [Acidimicrobiales bacterium]
MSGLLEGRGLVRRHEGLLAVDHVDVVARPGEVTAVIGPNGAGKTTLFDCLSGVLRPQDGVVLLDGGDITSLTPDERSRRGLVRTFQRSAVFPSLTVAENLMVGAENRLHQGALRGFLGLPDHDAGRATRIVEEVLGEIGLRPLRDVSAATLPTGTLRLVELARALCSEPLVLLLDEPASGLDDPEVDRMRDLLVRLAREGLTILLVEHDMDFVFEVADIAYAMVAGAILAEGPPRDIVDRPDVRMLILGMPQ